MYVIYEWPLTEFRGYLKDAGTKHEKILISQDEPSFLRKKVDFVCLTLRPCKSNTTGITDYQY